MPKFSGFVAFDVPIWPGLTERFVFPKRRRERRSSSATRCQYSLSYGSDLIKVVLSCFVMLTRQTGAVGSGEQAKKEGKQLTSR